MNFLVDAQLPPRLARFLSTAGHEVVHTSELPDANRTTDTVVARLADADDRVVVTKDRDFRASHLLQSSPRRLLIVATANIRNDELPASPPKLNEHVSLACAGDRPLMGNCRR